MTALPDVIWDLTSGYHSLKRDLICCLNSTHTPPPFTQDRGTACSG